MCKYMKKDIKLFNAFPRWISFVAVGMLLAILAASCSSDDDSKKSYADNPYKDIPATLLTDQGKLDMVRSIQNLKDGRFFYLDYTQDYKLSTI